MSRDEQDRLRDIQNAIRMIRRHLGEHGPSAGNEGDSLLHDALSFQFVIIGEAVKNLKPGTREKAPGIPWSSIAGLRDLIAHEYFDIDMSRIVEIIDRDLPALEDAVAKLLADQAR